jgi:hypothetical protein
MAMNICVFELVHLLWLNRFKIIIFTLWRAVCKYESDLRAGWQCSLRRRRWSPRTQRILSHSALEQCILFSLISTQLYLNYLTANQIHDPFLLSLCTPPLSKKHSLRSPCLHFSHNLFWQHKYCLKKTNLFKNELSVANYKACKSLCVCLFVFNARPG